MYSVEELKEKLKEKVAGLGIDPRFKESPAYDSAISEIDKLIGQMNMSEETKSVSVKEEQGRISFSWISPVGVKYSMIISCSSPETFRCVRTEERKPFVGINGQTCREKTAVEKVATIDKFGYITIISNGSMVNDIDCGVGKCNNTTWAERKYYTVDGVMQEREYKGFSGGELTEDFDKASANSMLYIPRQAFDFGFWNDKYETRTLLIRDKLDTARMVAEDKAKEIRYSATVPLNQESGLRDMVLSDGYDPYPQDVVITPLSPEEIEAMIQREKDPRVAKGLREYAVGRENYYYSTSEDKHFVCVGISQSQGRSK